MAYLPIKFSELYLSSPADPLDGSEVLAGTQGSPSQSVGITTEQIKDFTMGSAWPTYTVATLPTPGTAGRIAWASDCRVFDGAGTQEGAGVGTGGLVTDDGAAWKIVGTNVTAVA